jgi:predicted tellurium resistance membrane protein TerC
LDFSWLSSPDALIGLLTLAVMEIVLGVDNVIFISILAGKLPEDQQARARTIGLVLAMVMRIALLFTISWIVNELTEPIITVMGRGLSGKDFIILGGGLFLIWKATKEIHERLEGHTGHASAAVVPSFSAVITQILLLDIVFSLDSVITAVGMVDHVTVMVIAVIIAVGVMLVMAGRISAFVNRHPTVKMLALSFLLLIGFTLVLEGVHVEIPKGYIYFAMGFSVLVELLNLRASAKKHAPDPVTLHEPYAPDAQSEAIKQGIGQ